MSLILFVIVSIALVVSCYAELKKRGDDGIGLCLWKYFSYYTILSNSLVLGWITAQYFWPDSALGIFAKNANVSAAVTFYIFTVGVANYLIFGWQSLSLLNLISDLLVHAVTPVVTLIFWIVASDKAELSLSFLPYWLVYPLLYAGYTAAHGPWTHFYPYEFTDVQTLGAKRVALNALGLSFSLLIGGTIFILLGGLI